MGPLRETSRTGRYRCPRRRSTSRAHLGVFPVLASLGLAKLDAAALLDVVACIQRELDHDVSLDDGLAPQPRAGAQVPRGVEPVQLVVLGFAQVCFTLPDEQM